MKAKKDIVKIKDLRVLGFYGKMYENADMYEHSLRKLSKDVKKNDITAISIAALLLSKIIAPNAVIVPMPQSSGIAEYTLELANTICIIRQDCEVADILQGKPRKKLFDIKKVKKSLKGIHAGIKVKDDAACKSFLENAPNVFFVGQCGQYGILIRPRTKSHKESCKSRTGPFGNKCNSKLV